MGAATHSSLRALVAALEERILESDEHSCKRRYNSPGDDVVSHLYSTMPESDMVSRIRLADLEINNLELILRAAKEERRDLQCAHGRVVNSRAFINRLPYDIMVDVLNRYVDRDKRSTSIMFLNNTCHHWRNTILDTPRFWNRIALKIPAYVGGISADKLHAYAKLSKQIPLFLSITTEYPPPDNFEPIMQTLGPYLPHCTHLEMKIPHTFAQRIFTTPLPLLRSVFFSPNHELREPNKDYSVNPSRNAPLFDHLHLDHDFANPRLTEWSPERLNHLSINDTLLLRSPPSMPHLETLSINRFSDAVAFLDLIDTTPSLRTLRFTGDWYFTPWALERVIEVRSETDEQGQDIRPLGSVRLVHIHVDHPDDRNCAVGLANAVRYHLEHPAVNNQLEIVLNCGVNGSLDDLAPPLQELVTTYLPTGQVSLAFDDLDNPATSWLVT